MNMLSEKLMGRHQSKKDDAIKLGATEFYATKGQSELKTLAPIDHLLVTTSAQIPRSLYLPIMASPSMEGLLGVIVARNVCLRIRLAREYR